MKRKTNLFYTDGPDSKFITFSNYTESLTGNFLSTDTKLFPDKFLCLKIHNLNSSNKSDFIKYLVAYYENKLATLRDKCVENNIQQETELLPLAYLLEAILNVCKTNEKLLPIESGFVIDNDALAHNDYLLNHHKMTKDEYDELASTDKLITYIGNITEQDYNGTYTDIICSINTNEYYEGDIEYVDTSYSSKKNVCELSDINIFSLLHGWENINLPEEYSNDSFSIQPIYDNVNASEGIVNYSFNTNLSNIKFIKHSEESEMKTISFNIIIPLFSITNMNYKTNTTILEDEYINNDTNEQGEKCLLLDSNIIDTDNVKGCKDIPLGMWINADKEVDSFIELERDKSLNIYPSWSLLIGTQFKPFPYSLSYQKEKGINNSSLHAYPTFAETLSKINDVLDNFNKINATIGKLEERITSIDNKIKQIGTSSTISQLDDKMINLKIDVRNEINEFKKQLYGYIDNTTWSSNYKNNN